MAKAKKADAAAAPAAEGDAAAKVESPKKETAPKAGKVAKRGRKKKASPKKTKGKKKAAKKWSATHELSRLCNFQAALFWMGHLTVVLDWYVFTDKDRTEGFWMFSVIEELRSLQWWILSYCV